MLQLKSFLSTVTLLFATSSFAVREWNGPCDGYFDQIRELEAQQLLVWQKARSISSSKALWDMLDYDIALLNRTGQDIAKTTSDFEATLKAGISQLANLKSFYTVDGIPDHKKPAFKKSNLLRQQPGFKSMVDLLLYRDRLLEIVSRELAIVLQESFNPLNGLTIVWLRKPDEIRQILLLDFMLAAKVLGVDIPLPSAEHPLFKHSITNHPDRFLEELKNLLDIDQDKRDAQWDKRFSTAFYDSLTRLLQPSKIRILNDGFKTPSFLAGLELELLFVQNPMEDEHILRIQTMLEHEFDLVSSLLEDRFRANTKAELRFLKALFQPQHLDTLRSGAIYDFLTKARHFDLSLSRIQSIDEVPEKWPTLRKFSEGESIAFFPFKPEEKMIMEALLERFPLKYSWYSRVFIYEKPTDLAEYLHVYDKYQFQNRIRQALFSLLTTPIGQLDPDILLKQFAHPILLLKKTPVEEWRHNPILDHLPMDQEQFLADFHRLGASGYLEAQESSVTQLLAPYLFRLDD